MKFISLLHNLIVHFGSESHRLFYLGHPFKQRLQFIYEIIADVLFEMVQFLLSNQVVLEDPPLARLVSAELHLSNFLAAGAFQDLIELHRSFFLLEGLALLNCEGALGVDPLAGAKCSFLAFAFFFFLLTFRHLHLEII